MLISLRILLRKGFNLYQNVGFILSAFGFPIFPRLWLSQHSYV